MRDGYTDLPPGKLANVVTCLEMRERPVPRPEATPVAYALQRFPAPVSLERYRALFRSVGGEYLWTGRLKMGDEELAAILNDPAVEVYALLQGAGEAGVLELDFRVPGECEIVLFGVAGALIGTGAARWLMNRALERAWSHPIERVWLHTCTLDHPKAVAFYMRSGFVPFKRQVEIQDDPRVLGLLPRTAASHIPIL